MNINLSKYNIKPISDISSDESNFKLILGNSLYIVKELNSIEEFEKPRLILFDYSKSYLDGITIIPREDAFLSSEVELIKTPSNFWDKTTILFKECKNILLDNGFIAVKVNNSIKSQFKLLLDKIYGISKFVNEITIDSPFNVSYRLISDVFERTNSFLLYSSSSTPTINPVLNKKESGGYWHSFVSKGQGKPKKFVFNQKELILSPPPGTHWKLKQETIIELCSKGKIRLNKKGNPEYWVPSKKGQIVDSNWLDIPCFEIIMDQKSDNSSELYNRLLLTCMNKGDLVLDMCVDIETSLLVASKLDMKWIGVENNSDEFNRCLAIFNNNKISFTVYRQFMQAEYESTETSIKNKSIYSSKLNNKSKNHILVQNEVFPSNISTTNVKWPNEWVNMLIHGDSLDVLEKLSNRFRKKLKIVYIDPPFFTGMDENIIIPIGINSNGETSFQIQDTAYNNSLNGSDPIKFFVSWFKKRIIRIKPLLRNDGFLFVRFDYHFGHYAKMVLDEVFGVDNFVNEFLVRRMKKNLSIKQAYHQNHLIVHFDSLFAYRMSIDAKLTPSKIEKRKRKGQDKVEVQFQNDNVWLDIAGYEKVKKTLYPTENSESLLTRVIQVASKEGDIVADFFCGSGTTLAIAEKLGRKWIGVDLGLYSIHEVKKRILRFPERNQFILYSLKPFQSPTEKTGTKMANTSISHKSNDLPDVKLVFELKKRILFVKIVSCNPSKKGSFDKSKLADSIKFIDYWMINWNYQNRNFCVDWYSLRIMKGKRVINDIKGSTFYKYPKSGDYNVAVRIIDVFGNSVTKIHPISI